MSGLRDSTKYTCRRFPLLWAKRVNIKICYIFLLQTTFRKEGSRTGNEERLYKTTLLFHTHRHIQVIKLVASSLTWISCSSGSLVTAVVWTAGVNTLVVTR